MMFIFIFRLLMLFIWLLSSKIGSKLSISSVFCFRIFLVEVSGLQSEFNVTDPNWKFLFKFYFGLLSPLYKVHMSVEDFRKELKSSPISHFLEVAALSWEFSASSNFIFSSSSKIFCELSIPASTLSIKSSD